MAARRLGSGAVAACLGLLAGLSIPAAAQTVYRCGPAGNSYSQQPCADGRLVDVADPRSDAQVAEARAALRAQERWAARAARERRAEEAAHRPAGAVALGSLPTPPAPARKTERTPPRDGQRKKPSAAAASEGEFVATSPAPPRQRRSPR